MAPETSLSDFSQSYIHYDEGHNVMGTSAAMIVLSAAVVAFRFWARVRKQMNLGVDDWLMLMSLPILWSLAILGILAVKYGGVGRHLPIVMIEDPTTLGRSLLYLFAAEFVYGTVILTVKVSILSLYYRIFPTRSMKFSTLVLGAMTLAWWAAVVLVSAFQCSPIQKTWHPLMMGGHCLNKNTFFLGNAIPNIVLDVLFLILPIREVWGLQLDMAQKLAILSIFMLGGFDVIVSCIRLKAVVELDNAGSNADFTALIAPCWIWTTVEPTVGMVCASLPTMQPMLHLLFGRFMRSTPDRNINRSQLITIGGTGQKRSNDCKTVSNGSFEQLGDNDSADEPVLWPRNYATRRNVLVQTVMPENIALKSIRVQRDITWTEDILEEPGTGVVPTV